MTTTNDNPTYSLVEVIARLQDGRDLVPEIEGPDFINLLLSCYWDGRRIRENLGSTPEWLKHLTDVLPLAISKRNDLRSWVRTQGANIDPTDFRLTVSAYLAVACDQFTQSINEMRATFSASGARR